MKELRITPAQAERVAELAGQDADHQGAYLTGLAHGLIGVRRYVTVAGEPGRSARTGYRTAILNPEGTVIHEDGLT